MVRRAAFVLPALLLGLALTACGYALVGRGVNLPEDVREVYIKPLENRTPRSQVEQFLTRAIAEELVTRRRFAVVASAEAADAELSGAVVAFNATPVTFDDTGRATEYEISIVAQMAFRRVADEKVLWSNDRYVFRESYPVEVSEEGAFFDREDQAIEDAAERFATTMVSDLLEGF
jgi:outer membrane lipopolysaccharide assembly protein LptE/RlpB